MDFNNLCVDAFKLAKGLEELFGYEPVPAIVYSTKTRSENKKVVNADLELQPFEIKKGDITLNIIPYSIEDIIHNPRLVKTIVPSGISLSAIKSQIDALYEMNYI